MDLSTAALEHFGGALLLLDEKLRVVTTTSSAERLLGPVLPGVLAPKLLCGDGPERPVAEALLARKPVRATIRPSSASATTDFDARATPLEGGFLVELTPIAAHDREVTLSGFTTKDPKTIGLLELVRRAATADVTVLVRGETGTGKELIARAIHDLSPRARGPFQALNCAALSPMLLESELFGHVRGAFTGAVRDHAGHFRLAHGGTLFLDEVAELPLELQAKLLRALETRTVLPVGSTEPIPVDVRIVSATHRALRAEAEAGRFRPDLMYRLRVVPLFIPPLRDRGSDIHLLTDRLIASRNEKSVRKIVVVTDGARSAIERYPWPGNVRELQNAVDYAFVVGDGPGLRATDLPPEVLDGGTAPPLEGSETARIRAALDKTSGHVGQAAAMLGISRVTLWRRMKTLKIRGQDYAG